MDTEITSLLIALAAVIVGPIVTYLITKKNLEFQFRTIIKEKWVDKLTEASHSFLSNTIEWIEKYRGIKDGSAKTIKPEQEIDRMLDNINSSIVKLQLLLDKEKDDQNAILINAITIKDLVNKKLFDEITINNLRTCHEEMIDRLNKLFHQERTKMADTFRKNKMKEYWEKFKNLE
jgi:hypothetical protein